MSILHTREGAAYMTEFTVQGVHKVTSQSVRSIVRNWDFSDPFLLNTKHALICFTLWGEIS